MKPMLLPRSNHSLRYTLDIYLVLVLHDGRPLAFRRLLN
jgi:hypothetical protein